MKFRAFFLLFTTLLLVITPTFLVQGASSPWESVGEGIEYQKFILPDPNKVYVARMNRDNANVTLESSIAQGTLSGGFETVSGMAERYDQTINYWNQSWGSRNKVVVAINGSFYDTSTGVPRSGQVHSGWYAKRFDNLSGESGFAWKLDRTAFIGRCVHHYPEKQIIQHPASGDTIQFDGINIQRGINKLILYTPQYDNNTGTNDEGTEILVELTRPMLILPSPHYVKGYVREIRANQGSTILPFDHVVLSAHGTKADALTNINVGEEIHISQELTHFDKDCETGYPLDWTKTYASISGSFHFLIDGEVIHYDDPGAIERHPRTAIAYNDEYIFFIVVDGRDPQNSIGMSIDELASFTRDTLGATWGIAQDGGGSSTMVINGVVVNNPNANLLTHRLYLPMITNSASSSQQEILMNSEDEQQENMETLGIERYVANGMMMVVVEPMEKSSTYAPGMAIKSVTYSNIRLGPGTNYGILTTVPPDSEGMILDHMNNLNGILAKGYYWWKVSINGTTGWIAEGLIVPSGTP